ncbi:DUF3102 domain-containing protein [Ochrobactrum sp. A-1]|uniref:DUF3102 domain-containing protein n=1 Tax=Ochrobactrum sp. A-1 TaxID=2920940 RepID=UPI001F0B0B02|nr:DUF3102 domain-containing protein [Ochrobactrum sp. A-1]
MNAMPQQTDLEDFTGTSVDLFSYAALSREDEVAAKEDAAIIKAHMKSAAESIIAVGLALKRQKERLPHGMFLPWIEAEFEMSHMTATRFMNVAEVYGSKANTVLVLPPKALYELAAPSTPQSVREQVEELIVDGQKVTAADVKRLKADAKAAREGAEALATRNTELATKVKAKPAKPVDVEAIRAEAVAEVEARLSARIAELSEANVAARKEANELRKKLEEKPAKPDETNVVRPDFAQATAANADDDDDYSNPEAAMGAFAGALGAMEGLNFGAEDFWKRIGKKSTHGKRTYEAVIFVNEKLGQLIREYAK